MYSGLLHFADAGHVERIQPISPTAKTNLGSDGFRLAVKTTDDSTRTRWNESLILEDAAGLSSSFLVFNL